MSDKTDDLTTAEKTIKKFLKNTKNIPTTELAGIQDMFLAGFRAGWNKAEDESRLSLISNGKLVKYALLDIRKRSYNVGEALGIFVGAFRHTPFHPLTNISIKNKYIEFAIEIANQRPEFCILIHYVAQQMFLKVDITTKTSPAIWEPNKIEEYKEFLTRIMNISVPFIS